MKLSKTLNLPTKLIFFCFIVILACENGAKNKQKSEQVNIKYEQKLELLDSIALFDDTHYFNFTNTDGYHKDTLLAFSYPRLDLSFVSTEGRFLSKITQKGEGPGLLGSSQFIAVCWGKSGDIYVLRQDNSYMIYVFQSNGNYKGRVELFNELPDSFPILLSGFYVQDAPETFTATMSIGSTVYPRYSKKHYKNDYQIAQFKVDKKTLKVLDKSQKLLFAEESEIAEALKQGNFNWYEDKAIFTFDNGRFYKAARYSRQVKIYDRAFNFIKSVDFETLPRLKKGFSTSLDPDMGGNYFSATLPMERKLEHENVSIFNVQALGDIVLVQLKEPQEAGTYPVFTAEEFQEGKGYIEYDNIVIIKNLKTGNENQYRLPKRFHGKINLIDANHLLVKGEPSPDIEENYLYKFKF